jgi:hypothetical protein
MAVAYLLYATTATAAAPGRGQPEARSDLDALLVAREPIDGTPFDPTNASTYTAKPIAAKDDPLTGKVVPTLVHDQVADYGFGMSFPVTADGSGYPTTALKLFLKQAGAVKSVYLASRLTPLDAGANNVARAQLSRDLAGVVNQWAVDGAPDRYEVSVVLAPAFPSQASDSATAAALAAFDSSDPAFATSDGHDKYRTFVLDEDGSGHYANASTTHVTGTATTLDAVLGAPTSDGHGGTIPRYVKRRRPPVGTLFTRDTEDKPLRARLSISTDYAGTKPGLWDGTGHWQHVEGGWELLKDRVGVRVNVQHPNAWNVGKSGDANAPYKDGKVNAVEAVNGTKTPFFLRLTCVIEGDQALTAVAARQGTSPVAEVVERRVDARDRYAVETVTAKSEFNNASGATDDKVRDDTELATAEATAARTASEAGVFEGEVEVPFLTAYYQVGDRIDQVNGRGLGLRTDTGGTGYAPVYPSVVAVRWELDPGQRTVLTLSDAGLDRRRYGRRRKRSPGLPPVGDFGAAARPADPFGPRGALA